MFYKDPKEAAETILAKMQPPKKEEPQLTPEEESAMGFQSAAEEMMAAFEAKDKDGFLKALDSYIEQRLAK